jgi:hypothetical protein
VVKQYSTRAFAVALEDVVKTVSVSRASRNRLRG